MAPGDRVAKRLLSRGEIARSTGQSRKPATETVAKRGWRKEFHPRGGQLDRQRQAVELADDLGHHRGVFRRSA